MGRADLRCTKCFFPERLEDDEASRILGLSFFLVRRRPRGHSLRKTIPNNASARRPTRYPAELGPGQTAVLADFPAGSGRHLDESISANSYSSRGFVKYVIPFTLITGALIATDRKTSNLLPNTEDQSKWSLRVSQIGAPYSLAGIAAGMYLISRATRDKKARETGFLGAEAIAHTQILTLVLKSATRRERPADAKTKGIGGTAFWRGGDSFPSGHASGSFGLATIFAYEYGKKHKWVPYVLWSCELVGRPDWLKSTGYRIFSSAARWDSWWALYL